MIGFSWPWFLLALAWIPLLVWLYRRNNARQAEAVVYHPDAEFLSSIAKNRFSLRRELPVILYHLALAQPEARLLPTDASGQVPLACLSDLTWLSGTLHPIIARMFRPTSLSVADPNGVKAIAYAEMNGHAAGVSSRLEGQRWWYGDDWSITDVMLNWVFSTAGQYGFPYADFPVLAAHRERVEVRPSFIRARACEIRARERDSLSLPSGFKL